MQKFFHTLNGNFLPKGQVMSAAAREINEKVNDHSEFIIDKPDTKLIEWADLEYELFRYIEESQYGDIIRKGFSSMKDFIDVANSVLNRRKSRAGKSLEYHLEAIFSGNGLEFETQVVTEENKKPDFVFPSGAAYHSLSFDPKKLTVLGAKTTCKDRWRQVVTEADKVDVKYLCTLQQGISPQQLLLKAESSYLLLYDEQSTLLLFSILFDSC